MGVHCQVVVIRPPASEGGSEGSSADLLEPIPEASRMCVEYVHVSAEVPTVFAAPGLFPGLSLPSFGRKSAADAGPKARQVCVRMLHLRASCMLPGCVSLTAVAN